MSFNLEEFSNAVCHGLEYKRLAGLSGLVGESMLSSIAAEYLVAKGWGVQSEVDSRRIDPNLGYFGYDIVAQKPNNRGVIFEFKFLKAGRVDSKRVADDLVKLAYVSSPQWECFAIVGYDEGVKLEYFDRFKDALETRFFAEVDSQDNTTAAIVPSPDLKRRIANEFEGKFPSTCWVKCKCFRHGQTQLAAFCVSSAAQEVSPVCDS